MPGMSTLAAHHSRDSSARLCPVKALRFAPTPMGLAALTGPSANLTLRTYVMDLPLVADIDADVLATLAMSCDYRQRGEADPRDRNRARTAQERNCETGGRRQTHHIEHDRIGAFRHTQLQRDEQEGDANHLD